MHSKHGDWAVKAADAWRELKPRKLPSPETIAEQYDSILSWYQRTPWPTFEIIPTPAVDKILAEVDDMKAKGKVYRPPRVPELPETDDSDVETNQKIKTLLNRHR